MRKIGLLSDTHGYIDEKYFQYFNECDEIWHAGDIGSIELFDRLAQFKKLRAVYGNIDGTELRRCTKQNCRFLCEDVDVWITHIGGYPNKYAPHIKDMLIENPPQLFISGHSHILKVQYDNKLKLLHINPGAAGKYGFHKTRTLVRFEINGKEISNLEVIELKS